MTEDDQDLLERIEALIANAWDEDEHETLVEARDRIQAQAEEIERLKYDGIHSCHDQCARPLCVAWRENEKLRADAKRLLSEEPIATCEGCGAYLFDGDDYFLDPDGISGCWAMTNTPSKRERPCYSYRAGDRTND